MLLLTPPAVITQGEASSFDFERFKRSHIHPASDPLLVVALDRLYKDCPSFRLLLEPFANKQPHIVFFLKPMEEQSFGQIGITKLPNGYLVQLGIQGKLTRLGLDSYEPWLGFLIFGFHEISNQDGVVPVNNTDFMFNKMIEKQMWDYQMTLRQELKKANALPVLKLTSNGKVLYRMVVLGKQFGMESEN